MCRKLQRTLKVSLHETGNWHVAYIKETGFFEDSVEGEIPNQQDRFLEKWSRPKPIAPGVTLALRIVTPFSAVSTPIDKKVDKDIIWLPNCSPHRATEMYVFLVSPKTHTTSWPGKNGMGTKLVGYYCLKNGESVWVVYREIDVPDLSKFTKGKGYPYRGRTKEDLNSDDLRMFAFGNSPDGSKVIYDLKVSVDVS